MRKPREKLLRQSVRSNKGEGWSGGTRQERSCREVVGGARNLGRARTFDEALRRQGTHPLVSVPDIVHSSLFDNNPHSDTLSLSRRSWIWKFRRFRAGWQPPTTSQGSSHRTSPLLNDQRVVPGHNGEAQPSHQVHPRAALAQAMDDPAVGVVRQQDGIPAARAQDGGFTARGGRGHPAGAQAVTTTRGLRSCFPATEGFPGIHLLLQYIPHDHLPN